jgi:hypothetical protein
MLSTSIEFRLASKVWFQSQRTLLILVLHLYKNTITSSSTTKHQTLELNTVIMISMAKKEKKKKNTQNPHNPHQSVYLDLAPC